VSRTEWRWGCLLCGETGTADNADHAVALERTHYHNACPKKPGLRHPPPVRPGDRYAPWDELRSRQAWAAVRREVYGDGADSPGGDIQGLAPASAESAEPPEPAPPDPDVV
jgi:hypothetical protein